LFGDPAGAVALDPEQTLDGGRPEALGDLELDERHDCHLVLAKSVIGRRLGQADRFADDHQQLERDPGPVADPPERLRGEGGEPLEAGRVEEAERQGTVLNRSAHALERDPGGEGDLRAPWGAAVAGSTPGHVAFPGRERRGHHRLTTVET